MTDDCGCGQKKRNGIARNVVRSRRAAMNPFPPPIPPAPPAPAPEEEVIDVPSAPLVEAEEIPSGFYDADDFEVETPVEEE